MSVSIIGSGGGGFQVSPGINTSEIDLTTVVPATSTTVGALAGIFRWGPVDKVLLVDSENTLARRYGKPTSINPETWFTAANFLAYGNKLLVSRAANTTTTISAVANIGTVSALASQTVTNEDQYLTVTPDANVFFIARCPGDLGNSLKISVCGSADQFQSNIDLRNALANTLFDTANSQVTISVGSNVATVQIANNTALALNTPLPQANAIANLFTIGDYVKIGNSTIGNQYLKITGIGTVLVANVAGVNTGYASFQLNLDQPNKLSTDYTSNTVSRYWEFYNQVDGAPGQSDYVKANGNTAANDELHIIVTDADGQFTGNPGTVLEAWSRVSRATDAKTFDGATNYWKTVINNGSDFVWAGSDRSGALSANAANIASSTNTKPMTIDLAGGTDGTTESTEPFGTIARGYDFFQSAQDFDISLVLTGKSVGGALGEQVGNYLIDNIAEKRKDCVVFISPDRDAVVNNSSDIAEDVVAFANLIRSSSYAVIDSGYKYQYDKYNDVFRYIPLNGDIAGLCVATDSTRDPWFSPAGFNRGFIKNVVKLAWNPSQAERDLLYTNRVNPVVTFPGQGTILYGDKTALSRPSAFDRINVRRLFIVLEKAISRAAQASLFEFNDEFTQAQFKNIVEPFLRDIQGRRGIYDFKVVCDDTNNTPQVIDSNRFIGDIYIKPARSINFIQLNFVAVRTQAEFQEIVGTF